MVLTRHFAAQGSRGFLRIPAYADSFKKHGSTDHRAYRSVKALKKELQKERRGTVAVLWDRFLGFDGALLDELVTALHNAGLIVESIDGEEAAMPSILNPENFDLLLLADARVFPAMAVENLIAYLRKGGNLICIGAPLADNPVWKKKGEWVDRKSGEIALPQQGLLIRSAVSMRKACRRGE